MGLQIGFALRVWVGVAFVGLALGNFFGDKQALGWPGLKILTQDGVRTFRV
jgi:hypothetical protein